MMLLVLLLLCSTSHVIGDEVQTAQHMQTSQYYPTGSHGTTVCIEIRPAGHHTPTKVCGPMVHGGMQQQQIQQQTQQQRSEQALTITNPDAMQRAVDPASLQLQGEPKEAAPPCMRRFGGPMFVPRMAGESMMPMGHPLELEAMGWRQAGPPCPHEQVLRSMPPPMMVGPMLQAPVPRPYPLNMVPRSWFTPPGFRSAEEPESPPKNVESKEEYEHLLKECDEKTKILKQKEMEIAQLKGKMTDPKKDTEKPNSGKPQNMAPTMKS